MWASTTSADVVLPSRMAAASSVAERCVSLVVVGTG